MTGISDTQFIRLPQDTAAQIELSPAEVLRKVYAALKEKGYNPETQIVGYIMSGDPTYITNYQGARARVMKVERDELLTEMVHHYLGTAL